MLGDSSGSMVSRSTSPNGSVILSFSQQFVEKPEVMNLMYAIGMSSTLGIHTSRSCFDIVEFPACPAMANENSESMASSMVEIESSGSTTSAFYAAMMTVFVFVGSLY